MPTVTPRMLEMATLSVTAAIATPTHTMRTVIRILNDCTLRKSTNSNKMTVGVMVIWVEFHVTVSVERISGER